METTAVIPQSLGEAYEILRELLEKKIWFTFFARCEIEYSGRGASRSSLGDRLIIVKPSGSLIVHGPKGFKPENWQPDSSSITLNYHKNIIELISLRKNPREILKISIHRIYSVIWLPHPEKGEFYMYLSESDIRDYLALHPDLIEKGLRIVTIEKPVEPGFIDLYGVDKDGNIVVIEIKRVKAGEAAVRQIIRYLEALEAHGIKARGILVAPEFSKSALALAYRSGIETISIDLKRISRELERGNRKARSLLDFMK